MESENSGPSRNFTHSRSRGHRPAVLVLLQKLVQSVPSDLTMDVQRLDEFPLIIRRLCEKAPKFAEVLAKTILETSNSIKNFPQQEQEPAKDHNSRFASPKRKTRKNLPYQTRRATEVLAANSSSTKCPPLAKDSQLVAGCAMDTPDVGPITVRQYCGEVDGNMKNGEVDALPEIASQSGQQRRTTRSGGLRTQEKAAHGRDTAGGLNKTTDQSPEVAATFPSLNLTEGQEPSATSQGVTCPQKASITRTEPKSTVTGTSPTPLAADPSASGSESQSSSPEATSWLELVTEAVRVIHYLSKYPYAVPTQIHARILQTHRKHSYESSEPSTLDQWTDGSMWMNILRMGSTQHQKTTIFNMIEYIGAWEWYDRQVALAKTWVRSKRNKPVGRKGAAKHVLDRLQRMQRGSLSKGIWVGGVGRLNDASEDDATEPDPDRSAGVTEAYRRTERKRISVHLSRGQKLTTLIKAVGLGILFSPKIWQVLDYTKAKDLEQMIKGIQKSPKHMGLLHILSPQLELLVERGQPDLHALYDALYQEKLVSPTEIQEFRMTFALDSDPLPQGSLDVAVHGLIKDVGTRVLGKRKLDVVDTVSVNDLSIPCDTFERLQCGEWLNDDLIHLAMDISDKPEFVKHGYSVPLDDVGKTRTTKPIGRPFAAWARRVARLRDQAGDVRRDAGHLVHFCPVSHKGNHFTLLEINDREKVIRHYDSMAARANIDDPSTPTRVAQLVEEEFASLQYAYSEVVRLNLPRSVFVVNNLMFWPIANSTTDRNLGLWSQGGLELQPSGGTPSRIPSV
ncbi:hypothetical protein AYL99_11900 [Fonsecaea erecta]|uniref:Ubiquitin-like protease family profile domain-containing protein n=1 Tax=Fonsecaea erecta TaxID=1367422 RepID=A0A178Z254_9EURO|nr:hypothetical protein AYL99_11900 [Fonsecaea erecta]OAP53878.1 hypothetical protein AYL99_11900 [Fonsecaea erecta]